MEQVALDPRAQEILRCIIATYILTGEPVGSRAIARRTREGLSPASVRNVMADLEEMGLLAQPHTSAGRIPTDRGYRYYVDALLPQGRIGPAERALIDARLSGTGGEFSEAIETIPRLLSQLSHQVGYLLAPRLEDGVLKHIEFVRLHDRRVLVIFVDSSGVVSHRVLQTEVDYGKEDLDRAGRYLVAEFSGLALSAIRRRLVDLMAEEKAAFDRLVQNAVALGTRYLEAEAGERRLVLDGTANIVTSPEFSDAASMRRLLEAFEEKHRLVQLLDRCLERGGVQVLIGSEGPDPALGGVSLVACPYRVHERATGWLGILGPTRMEYDRAVALVDYISRLLSSLLLRPGA